MALQMRLFLSRRWIHFTCYSLPSEPCRYVCYLPRHWIHLVWYVLFWAWIGLERCFCLGTLQLKFLPLQCWIADAKTGILTTNELYWKLHYLYSMACLSKYFKNSTRKNQTTYIAVLQRRVYRRKSLWRRLLLKHLPGPCFQYQSTLLVHYC